MSKPRSAHGPHEQGLRTHLDGARLWNAAVATGIPLQHWAQHFDTVSVCFSKGLGAPVGSALAGPKDLIAQAKRLRKVLGGGTRQGGIIAAGALYALEHHIDRLAEDHAKAQILAKAITAADGLELVTPNVETNIVMFRVEADVGTAAEFCKRLKDQGVFMLPVSAQQIRAVTHLDVSEKDAEQCGKILQETATGVVG